jgi:hypothetical protein
MNNNVTTNTADAAFLHCVMKYAEFGRGGGINITANYLFENIIILSL